MKYIFCVIGLVIAIFVVFCPYIVQADYEQDLFDDLREDRCLIKTRTCAQKVGDAGIRVAERDRRSLCIAQPVTTTAAKCLMDCMMVESNWMNDKGFQKDKYLEFIKKTSLGQDGGYVKAAEKAADLCKNKKASFQDSCETASIIMKCLQDEGNKLQRINLGYTLFYVEPFFLEFD